MWILPPFNDAPTEDEELLEPQADLIKNSHFKKWITQSFGPLFLNFRNTKILQKKPLLS